MSFRKIVFFFLDKSCGSTLAGGYALAQLVVNPKVSQGIKSLGLQPVFRFQLRPGINSAVLLCRHTLPSAAVNTEMSPAWRNASCLLGSGVWVACQDPIPSLF